jgi:hypothetical protein
LGRLVQELLIRAWSARGCKLRAGRAGVIEAHLRADTRRETIYRNRNGVQTNTTTSDRPSVDTRRH